LEPTNPAQATTGTHPSRSRSWANVTHTARLLALAGLIALFVALAATPAGQTLLGLSGAMWDDVINFFRSVLGLAPKTPSV